MEVLLVDTESSNHPVWHRKAEAWLASHRILVGWAIVLGAFLLFTSNRTHVNGGDQRGLVDLSWWTGEFHVPRLNGHPAYPENGQSFGYWAMRQPSGTIAPVYPVGTILYTTPVFALLNFIGVQISHDDAPVYAKLFASAMMAFACWVVWYVLGSTAGWLAGLLGAVLLAGGSPLFTNQAQALWIQTGAIFSQALSAYLIVPWLQDRSEWSSGRKGWLRLVLGGFFAAWATACRPTFAIWSILFLVFGFLRMGKKVLIPLLGSVLAGVLAAVLFWISTGSPIGLYGVKVGTETSFSLSPARLLEAASGLLISPSRGLLLFAPWTILLLAGMARFLIRKEWQVPWMLINALFVGTIFLTLASFDMWWGGWCDGPRLQADLLLSAVFVSAPVFAWLTQRGWGILLILFLFAPAAYVHGRASRTLNFTWEAHVSSVEQNLWNWRHSEWMWNATGGSVASKMRPALGEPLWEQVRVRPETPGAERFLERGIELDVENDQFALTHREAIFAFILPPLVSSNDVMMGVDLVDSTPMHRRRVRFDLNGSSIGTCEYIANASVQTVAFLIPKDTLRQKEINRLRIVEDFPVQGPFGLSYLGIRQLYVLPPRSDGGKALDTLRIDRHVHD